MFILLNKFIPAFVYPLSLSLVLLGIASVLGRRSGWMRALCLGAFLLLLLFSNGAVSNLLLHSLEEQYPPVPIESVSHADAIVVLRSGTSSGPGGPGQLPS